jgi:hypothetical protein
MSIPNLMQIFNPQGGGGGMPDGATTNTGGGWGDFLSSIFRGASPFIRYGAGQYASGRAADEMNEQAGRYEQLGERAAGMASPVSNARRGEWDARLSQLYEDPAAFLEKNPEYQANMKLGLGKILAENSARGHNLGGKATTDQLEFLSDLSSRYVGKERDDLMAMAGYQFNPASAAQMLMEGGRQAGDARAQALAARLYPLGMLSGEGGSGGGGGPGGGSSGSGNILSQIARMLGGNQSGGGGSFNPQSMLQAISRLPLGSLPPGLFESLGQIPGGVEGLFGGMNPDQLRSLFGPGYESFVTQNVPGFADGSYNPSVFGPGLSTGFGQFGGPFAPLGEGGFTNPFEGFGDFGLGDGSWDWSQVFGDDFWTTGFGGDMGLEDISSFFDF